MFKFNDSKISSQDSIVIIKSIRSLMSLGNSLLEAIKLQREIETGENAKILSNIIFLVEKKNQSIEKLFLQFNVINESECLIMLNAKDTKESLDSITNIRSVSKNFNKTIITLTMFPIVAFFVGLGIAKFLLPAISKPVNDLIAVAKLKNGIDIDKTLNIPDVFFYIHHPEYINYIIPITILFLIGIFFEYKYLEKNNPSLIYKFLPLKSYDDIPFIFILMRSLNKGGLDLYSIVKLLQNSNLDKGWRLFFLRLRKQIENNKEIHSVFKSFGFPRQIYIVIKTAEKSKSFWESFDGMIAYAQDINLIKNKEIVDRYKNIGTIFGYVVIIFFLLGILLLMFSMQNIIMAMQ